MSKEKKENLLLEERIKEKIISFWQSYRPEVILIFISLVIFFVSLGIFLKINKPKEESLIFEEDRQDLNYQPQTTKIFVDVSGAVEKPDVYEVSVGARLKDALMMANGLSKEADRVFFYRNFNLARILTDQEKIYIPSQWETQSGLFQEKIFVVDQIKPRVSVDQKSANSTPQELKESEPDKININSASMEELDTLPGVGKVTAQKIINNRPYQSIEELLTKKVVGKSVYEKIKDLVSLE